MNWIKLTLSVILLAFVGAVAVRQIWIERKIQALYPGEPRAKPFFTALPPRGDRLRILMIGDSSISRWPKSFGDGLAYEVINRGVGGETTSRLAARFKIVANDATPDVIFISAGLNDLVAASFMSEKDQAAVIKKATEVLLQLAREGAQSGACVLLSTLIPPSTPEVLRLLVWRDSVRDLVAEFNQILRQTALPGRVRLIDLAAALDSHDRATPQIFRADALHLNAIGYQRLTSLLLASLSTIKRHRASANTE